MTYVEPTKNQLRAAVLQLADEFDRCGDVTEREALRLDEALDREQATWYWTQSDVWRQCAGQLRGRVHHVDKRPGAN